MNYPEFQIKSYPTFWDRLKGCDVVSLSTVQLPFMVYKEEIYETRIFWQTGEIEVVDKYRTRREAIDGHNRYKILLNLS